MNLDSETAYNLIFKAYEEKVTDRLWHLYSCTFPHMDPEKRISFDEFLNSIKEDTDQPSTEKILSDVKNILDDFTTGSG